MLLPVTPLFTQVLVTLPCVQPVVRPTLLTTSLTTAAGLLLVMVNAPVIVREPLFGPLVFSMPPSVKLMPLAYAARAASLCRQRRPLGQPGRTLRVSTGSSTSVAIWTASTLCSGCQYGVFSTPPCVLVQCDAVTNEFWPPFTALKPMLQMKPGKLI